MELSRATFDNWVAKASGLLAEECAVEAGSTVMLDLEPHWLLPVWAWATWSLGATVALPGVLHASHTPVDVLILDNYPPEPPSDSTKDSAADATGEVGPRIRASTVLLSSRHPLGLSTRTGPSYANSTDLPAEVIDALPAEVIDALADIRAYPDVRTDPVPEPGGPLVTDGQMTVRAGAELAELLSQTPIDRAAVLRSRPRDATALARALLAPAFNSAMLVIIDGGQSRDIDAIRAQEQADVDLD